MLFIRTLLTAALLLPTSGMHMERLRAFEEEIFLKDEHCVSRHYTFTLNEDAQSFLKGIHDFYDNDNVERDEVPTGLVGQDTLYGNLTPAQKAFRRLRRTKILRSLRKVLEKQVMDEEQTRDGDSENPVKEIRFFGIRGRPDYENRPWHDHRFEYDLVTIPFWLRKRHDEEAYDPDFPVVPGTVLDPIFRSLPISIKSQEPKTFHVEKVCRKFGQATFFSRWLPHAGVANNKRLLLMFRVVRARDIEIRDKFRRIYINQFEDFKRDSRIHPDVLGDFLDKWKNIQQWMYNRAKNDAEMDEIMKEFLAIKQREQWPAKAEELPEGWNAAVDENLEFHYYYKDEAGRQSVTQREKPTEDTPIVWAESTTADLSNWKLVKDSGGDWNTETDETQRDNPEGTPPELTA